MSDPPTDPPSWFRDYLASQVVDKNQKEILAKIDGLQDTLNKIIIAIAAVGGSEVGLKFVHSTPDQIAIAALGGFLLVFSLGTFLYRYKRLPKIFRLLMLMNTVAGVLILASLAMTNDLFNQAASIFFIVLLFGLTVISWNVDKWAIKK